jgi:hypothetical protein
MTVDEQLWIPRCAIAHLRFDASRRPGTTVFVEKITRAALGGRKAARALKEEGGAPPPSLRRQIANFRRRLNISRITLSVSSSEPVIILSSASVAVRGSLTVSGIGAGNARFMAF